MAYHTFDERAKAEFAAVLAKLLQLTGWTYKQLADQLCCSEREIVKMKANPLTVSGRYTERTRQLLREEELRICEKYGLKDRLAILR